MKEAAPSGEIEIADRDVLPDENSGFHVAVHGLGPEEAVGRLIDHAVAIKSSDLYFFSNENHVAVLARHLGIVRLLTVLNLDLGRRCLNHIKAVAGMDVVEHRRPQDGRWLRHVPGQDKTDLRISTIPTLYGEDFTMRLLVRQLSFLGLEHLGLELQDFQQLLNILNSPSGLVLVTGPTGSGKTTTLYACLAYLNNGLRKINTIEDPVEYGVEGIRQSQVNLLLNVDFPELLRSVLRQAPDIIMVGEIRDALTAETAVRAANSGHLVLATLHAPIAAGAIQSMLTFGIPHHFLGSALRGIIAQRLVRTLCAECKTSVDLSLYPQMFEEVKPWLKHDEGHRLFAAFGCDACHKTGYTARTGVFEVLVINQKVRQLIFDKQPTQIIRQKALADGLLGFRQAALLKVARGHTSADEVLRVVPTEYLGLED
jgi:type II secretory ATPase GspE/PulE/Tfp pilus assembly ATPase PilB-like protein